MIWERLRVLNSWKINWKIGWKDTYWWQVGVGGLSTWQIQTFTYSSMLCFTTVLCLILHFDDLHLSKTQHTWSRALLFTPRISRLIAEVDENKDDEIELSEFLCLLAYVRRLMLLGEEGMTYHPWVARVYVSYTVCKVLGAHIFRGTLANQLGTQRLVQTRRCYPKSSSNHSCSIRFRSKYGAILLLFQNVKGW